MRSDVPVNEGAWAGLLYLLLAIVTLAVVSWLTGANEAVLLDRSHTATELLLAGAVSTLQLSSSNPVRTGSEQHVINCPIMNTVLSMISRCLEPE